MHNWLRDLGWGLIGIKQDLSRLAGKLDWRGKMGILGLIRKCPW